MLKIFSRLFNKEAQNHSVERSNSNNKNSDSSESKKRIYLNVPYVDKEVAKRYGAKWHPERKQWYIQGEIIANEDFAKWLDYKEKYCLFAMHFYLAEKKRTCWNCRNKTPVFSLLYDTYEHLESELITIGSREIWVNQWYKENEPFFAPLSDLTSETINNLLTKNHPVVKTCIKLTKNKKAQQYCTHCHSKQGNHYLFEEVDAPFSFYPEVLEDISLYKVNIPVKSVSSPTYGPLEAANKRSFLRNSTIEIIP